MSQARKRQSEQQSDQRLVNVYDFDHTIYRGDSSIDFVMFCMMRDLKLWKHIPRQAIGVLHYVLGTRSRKQAKQAVFSFLQSIDDIDSLLEAFWSSHDSKLTSWYLRQKSSSDIIISASPEFLITPLMSRIGVPTVLATKMDHKTGRIAGKNCRGPEKVRRLQAIRPIPQVNNCYSDHLSDKPLFDLAHHPFMVQKSGPLPLDQYRPSKLSAIASLTFVRFLIVGGFNATLGVLFSYVYSRSIANPLFAFMLGYATSLVISYFLNAVMTFKESSFSMRQFLNFCIAYIPNFFILSGVVHVMANLLDIAPIIAYITAALLAAPITFLLLSHFTFTKWRLS